jgi:hypothetical protein
MGNVKEIYVVKPTTFLLKPRFIINVFYKDLMGIVSDDIRIDLRLKNTNARFKGSKSRYQLKVVDYNHDGFPDIMAYFENDRYYLFRSTPCSSQLCADPKMRRAYVEDTAWSKAFEKIPGADMHAVWADFNGDVILVLKLNSRVHWTC